MGQKLTGPKVDWAKSGHCRVFFPVAPPNTTSPPRLRVCRAAGCHSSTHTRCRVGVCSNRCTGPALPCFVATCIHTVHVAACSELVQPGCPVGCCSLHCTSRAVHFTIPYPCWETTPGGGSLLNDGALSFPSITWFRAAQLPPSVGGPTTPSTTASWAW